MDNSRTTGEYVAQRLCYYQHSRCHHVVSSSSAVAAGGPIVSLLLDSENCLYSVLWGTLVSVVFMSPTARSSAWSASHQLRVVGSST